MIYSATGPTAAEGQVAGTTYGMHLLLRIDRIERPGLLESPEVIRRFLPHLVGQIGMTVLAGPLTEMFLSR